MYVNNLGRSNIQVISFLDLTNTQFLIGYSMQKHHSHDNCFLLLILPTVRNQKLDSGKACEDD